MGHDDDSGPAYRPDEDPFYNRIKKSDNGSVKVHQILKELGEIHDKKQRDYGVPEDPFANVRSSVEWGIPGWVGCMVRANDKIRRLQTMAKTGKLSNESARDSFLDLAVYAIIGLCLFEEGEGK